MGSRANTSREMCLPPFTNPVLYLANGNGFISGLVCYDTNPGLVYSDVFALLPIIETIR
jgi:hypothetical protein